MLQSNLLSASHSFLLWASNCCHVLGCHFPCTFRKAARSLLITEGRQDLRFKGLIRRKKKEEACSKWYGAPANLPWKDESLRSDRQYLKWHLQSLWQSINPPLLAARVSYLITTSSPAPCLMWDATAPQITTCSRGPALQVQQW